MTEKTTIDKGAYILAGAFIVDTFIPMGSIPSFVLSGVGFYAIETLKKEDKKTK